MGLFDLIQPERVINNVKPVPGFVMIFHFVVAILVIIVFSYMITLLGNATVTSSPPTGWNGIDYDIKQLSRDTLTKYLAAQGLTPENTVMNTLSVATANFGGIFTENIGMWNPWNGSVDPDAARLQVEAGARAVILDIWPDPSDLQTPVVCTMLDTTEWYFQNVWIKLGLHKGVGRYSNWNHLTRNKRPAVEIITTLMKAAFNGVPGPQNTDPFFLILKLHGGMSTDYLNRLGDIVHDAIGGHAMGAEWNKCLNQKGICTAMVNAFMSKVFIIVIPDVNPNYNILPNVNTHAAFVPIFLTTRLGEITNAVEQSANTMCFEPTSITTISAAGQANCQNPTGPPQSLAQVGFCIVQPTIGGKSTVNSELFAQNGYNTCLQSGAQFVAVNLFSSDRSDGPLTTFFEDKYFGKYSFRKI